MAFSPISSHNPHTASRFSAKPPSPRQRQLAETHKQLSVITRTRSPLLRKSPLQATLCPSPPAAVLRAAEVLTLSPLSLPVLAGPLSPFSPIQLPSPPMNALSPVAGAPSLTIEEDAEELPAEAPSLTRSDSLSPLPTLESAASMAQLDQYLSLLQARNQAVQQERAQLQARQEKVPSPPSQPAPVDIAAWDQINTRLILSIASPHWVERNPLQKPKISASLQLEKLRDRLYAITETSVSPISLQEWERMDLRLQRPRELFPICREIMILGRNLTEPTAVHRQIEILFRTQISLFSAFLQQVRLHLLTTRFETLERLAEQAEAMKQLFQTITPASEEDPWKPVFRLYKTLFNTHLIWIADLLALKTQIITEDQPMEVQEEYARKIDDWARSELLFIQEAAKPIPYSPQQAPASEH